VEAVKKQAEAAVEAATRRKEVRKQNRRSLQVIICGNGYQLL